VAIACPDCGTILELPSLGRRTAVVCPTCDHHLERSRGRSQALALSLAVSTLVLLIPADIGPLMRVSMLGVDRVSRVGSGIYLLWDRHWVIVATLVALFVIVLPLIRYALLSLVLICLHFRKHPPWLGHAFRRCLQLDLWAMPDVFLLGAAVGYSRVTAELPVHVGWGGGCLMLAAACAMLCRAALDRRTVWRGLPYRLVALPPKEPAISCVICDLAVPARLERSGCPRCGARLSARRPSAVTRTSALVLAGLALYVPANLFPMSSDSQFGATMDHRIVDGIRELFQAGLWPLGVLIFCTSIAIPLLKLAGLGWFLLCIRRRSTDALVFKTKLYRVIEEVGRWSNVDVFTIAVFLPLIQFGQIASTHADLGATAFILVVVLTMFASRCFDPRLMWDVRAAERG
jgi:paraquat-inducible protein A